MAVEFRTLIAANKRNSWLLISGFTLFVVLLGGLIGYSWAGMYGPEAEKMAPAYALLAMAIAFTIAVIGGAASYYGGASAILAMSRAREIGKHSPLHRSLPCRSDVAGPGGGGFQRVPLLCAHRAETGGRDPGKNAGGMPVECRELVRCVCRELLSCVLPHHFDQFEGARRARSDERLVEEPQKDRRTGQGNPGCGGSVESVAENREPCQSLRTGGSKEGEI